MPKKSLYWPGDSNCDKLSSKTLRCLRDKPNKLTSGPRRIHSLCESLKHKHYKANNKEKFRQIEDFRGFLSNETILAQHKKARPKLRQVLQSKVNETYSSSKNLSSNNSWKKRCSNTMAVDFDHMYIDCGDSKISIGRDIEFQHLKELNLLHLDLIQQQAEQLISKDKIIKSLKEENKNLRSRLERIERRLSLSLQKKSSDLSPISVQTDFGDDVVSFPFYVKPECSPRGIGYKSPARSPIPKGPDEKSPQLRSFQEEDASPIDSSSPKRDLQKRLSSPKQQQHQTSIPSLSPIQHVLRGSPREKRAKKDGMQHPVVDVPVNRVASFDVPCALSPSPCDTRKSRSPTSKRNLVVEAPTPSKRNKNVESSCEREKAGAVESEGITNHSLRSRDKSRESGEESSQLQTPKPDDVLSVQIPSQPHINEKINSSIPINSYSAVESEPSKLTFKGSGTRKVRSEGILTTSDSYYLPASHSSLYLLDTPEEDELMQVEIPQWRIKVLSSLYVMEGTENLEDEIFLKRHGKPEQDERRRKRWDLQRMREQRQYEKLRERYEVRNNKSGSRCGSRESLWPSPESATSLQIDNYLPVCAFGQPLAQIPESEFFVPWLTGKTPLQVGISTRRKKR